VKPPPRWLARAPLVRGPLRRAAKRFAPRGPVDVRVEGLALRLAPADNKVDFDIWYKRRLEEAGERDFIARHLAARELFVDVGANIGLYTLSVLARVPGARALSFEPLERLRRRLVVNLALNGLSGRAIVRSDAVGPAGRMALHESANAGRSSLVPFPGARRGGCVSVRPLAEVLGWIGVPAALKIDVEGFEDAALLPYFDAVGPERWPRAVVIETLHRALWQRDCLQELFQRGYVPAGETAENALLLRPGS